MSLVSAPLELAAAPFKLAAGIMRAGTRAERAARAALWSTAQAMALDAVEAIVARAIEGPELRRMLADAIASPLAEELVADLLESEQLWVLVDEIARSPSVTEAISHQSMGFVEEVADRARARARSADAQMQRLARRLSRRAVNDRAEQAAATSLSNGELS